MKVLLSVIFFSLTACGQMAPGTGEGFYDPHGREYALLREAAFFQFNDRIRLSLADQEWYRVSNPSAPRGSGDIQFSFGTPGSGRRDICSSLTNSTDCGSIAIGNSVISDPIFLSDLENWLVNFCTRFPSGNSKAALLHYSNPATAPNIRTLRMYFGCEDDKHVSVAVHIYIISNFDRVFTRVDEGLSERLKANLVRDMVVKITN